MCDDHTRLTHMLGGTRRSAEVMASKWFAVSREKRQRVTTHDSCGDELAMTVSGCGGGDAGAVCIHTGPGGLLRADGVACVLGQARNRSGARACYTRGHGSRACLRSRR